MSALVIISLLGSFVLSGIHAGPVVVSSNAASVPAGQSVAADVSSPYEFGYQSVDTEGTRQHRLEFSNGKSVRGSYGYVDPLGVYRTVRYEADEDGYRAVVSSNEPGVGASSANALYVVEPPPQAALAWQPPKLIAVKK